nr:hypothetical protein [uncultured Methanolobus sp.]
MPEYSSRKVVMDIAKETGVCEKLLATDIDILVSGLEYKNQG